jgi:division/cell wall cluster transcriptional repressor MraZ
MALFVGEFEQAIDAKHRLAINAPLRETMDPKEDGENFVLVLGPDRHLRLYPDLAYKRMLSTLHTSPLPSRDANKTELLHAMARIVKMDGQGRIVLPEKSMQRGILDEKVTLVGQIHYITIWPTAEWEKHVEESFGSYGETLYEASERMSGQTTK